MTGQSKVSKKPISRGDSEFLPAALEILETPASPVRAALIWLICGFATLSLVWAYVGQFDIVATAQGKVQPVGRVKIVQSEEAGRVITANASNGLEVRSGDILIELDPTTARAEKHAIELRLQALEGEITRRRAQRDRVIDWSREDLTGWAPPSPAIVLSFPTDVDPLVAKREQQLYEAEIMKLAGALVNLQAQHRKGLVQVERLKRTIGAQQTFVDTLTERVTMRSRLVDADAGSKAVVIDARQALLEGERDLVIHQGEHLEASAALEVIVSESRSQLHSFLSDNAQRLNEALREADQMTQELAKASRKLASMTIRSPDSGVIQASSINTVGQFLSPGTELMRIVPRDQKLEIEALLPNRDIGFVSAGQEAVLKVEAFPFTRYGILHGKVIRVATDAIPEPDARQKEELSTGEMKTLIPVSNVQRVQNLVYPVIIEPVETDINVDGRSIPLSAGMTVTVEMKTGQRRILEYLFSPIAEVSSSAMKER